MDDKTIDREFEKLRKEYTYGSIMFDIPVRFIPTVKMIVKVILHREHDHQVIKEILCQELKCKAEDDMKEAEHMIHTMSESEEKREFFRFTYMPRNEDLLLRDHPLNGMVVPPSIRCKFCGRQPMQGARFGYTIDHWNAAVGICPICRQELLPSNADIRKWGDKLPPTEGEMKLL